MLNGPNRFTVTSKPSFISFCRASPMPMPSTFGMATWGGPADTPIVTVSLTVIGVPGPATAR